MDEDQSSIQPFFSTVNLWSAPIRQSVLFKAETEPTLKPFVSLDTIINSLFHEFPHRQSWFLVFDHFHFIYEWIIRIRVKGILIL